MNLGAYVLRRALLSVVVIFGTIAVTFFLSHIVPANPAILLAGQNPTPEQVARITTQLGLDKPLYIQFVIYVENLLSGSLGLSPAFSLQPVLPLILQALPNTLTLATLATLVAVGLGIPIGVEAARSTSKKTDALLRIFSVSFVALPQFWLGLLLQLIFAVRLGIFPLSSYGGTLLYTDLHPIRTVTGSYLLDTILTGDISGFLAVARSMVLPVLTLAFFPLGYIARHTRSSVQGVLSQDYIRTARAYGISEREINYRFALRNALAPILVIMGIIFATSAISVFYVEDVFVLAPGLGFIIRIASGTGISSTGIGSVDFTLILGVAIVSAILYVGANFAVDLLQAYYDRRILG